MLRRKRPPRVVLFIALISFPCYPQSFSTELLSGLEGSWRGQAVHTPVGPAPYNVVFSRNESGCVAGTAYTGFSNHSWTFCPAEDGINLNFLSDFRGNDDPILLESIRWEQEKVVFKSAKIAFMDVILARADGKFTIDIMHHDELHVRIELTPAGPAGPR